VLARGYTTSGRLFLAVVWLAGVWAAFAPVLVFAPIFQIADPGGLRTANALQAGRLAEVLPVLVVFSGAGLLGLAGTALLARGRRRGRVVLGAAAGLLLVLTMLAAASFGILFFPAAMVLVVAALWLPHG
jgi:hypothetical protein